MQQCTEEADTIYGQLVSANYLRAINEAKMSPYSADVEPFVQILPRKIFMSNYQRSACDF